jgi:hypothetical protein
LTDDFLSGESGMVARRDRPLRLAADRLLDARLRLSGANRRLDAIAAAAPRRSVLVLSVYAGDGGRLARALPRLRSERHDVTVRLGAMGEPAAALASETAAARMSAGKFANLNELRDGTAADWVIVVDDDVDLPPRFLDRFVGVCERYGLALAQPAQTLASHAAWRHTRRQRGSELREAAFVEIGPVTAFRRDAAAELMPFPELRFGWGIDSHWAAVAAERGWRLGIVDALPVRHETREIATGYRREDAITEARDFLAERPYVRTADARRTLAEHRRLSA